MKAKIKVTIEYWAGWKTTTSEDYKIVRIAGSPTVEVCQGDGFRTARINDFISEKQAAEMASRDTVEVITIPKSE